MQKRTLPLWLGAVMAASIFTIAGCGNGNNPLVPHMRPVEGGTLSSGYGPRESHPVKGYVAGGHHDGYDFAVGTGAPIRASMAGKVTFVGVRGGYGKTVVLEHPDGYATLYGHASELLVKEGQQVMQGTTIALVGSTGISTGPHLHYELLKNGLAVNPGPFLNEEDPVAMAAANYEPPAVRKLTVKTQPRKALKVVAKPRIIPAYFQHLGMVPVGLPGRTPDRS